MIISTLTLLLLVLLSSQLHYSWRVMLFFLQFSFSMLTFFILFHSFLPLKRYDMPEDFLVYPFAVVLMSSTLFLLDAERTIAWHEGLGHYGMGMLAVWLAAFMAVVYEERFILHAQARFGGRIHLFLSAALFYMILYPLMN
ncbi:hypothetical protein [Entomospira culicis]|uniref:Uncharacterized protein n=1 Tax=Entomospira culicis TaxID=2719989 RepID=A0A968GI56_9SPIO|nr:hypothetical protein [Entomospira culicis]NIZ19613.1 hypothetical protein [Entomospira culicis]NIZ69482.1 hypothetical protein [Entomospira culicis]WDI36597.1 hypothetical protein PVA46_04540 [Entomospira culicis]WDI38225.1 hypothetical protein PVA47_04550 [Entomospira culicis]